MKYKYKTLLFVLSLMMFSLLTFNTSFVCAETNKTIISFIDENGNPLDIEDTVSITKLEDQGGTKVPVSVYIKDGKETTDYNNGTPLDELQIKDGKLEIEGLTKDNEYLLSFDNDFVFQKEESSETKYYMFGSFKGENDTNIYSSDLKPVEELSQEQLEEISGTGEIMELAIDRIAVSVSCDKADSIIVREVDSTYSNVISCNNNGKGATCTTSAVTNTPITFDMRMTCDGYKNDFTWTATGGSLSSKSYNCTACGYSDPTPACKRNTTRTSTCSYKQTATQYYDSNGGYCGDRTSDTRTKDATSRTDTCNTKGTGWSYGSCSTSYWTGSVSQPSCSKGDGSESATISYNGNKGSGSTNITQSKTSDTIFRAIHYKFDGFDNYQENFTSDTTATAKYSESGRDNWPSVTLPSASRVGYTFKGWQADDDTYSEGQTVWPYTASWEANPYEYTIEFRSSTGKLLDTRKETHSFDETITISHDSIPGH